MLNFRPQQPEVSVAFWYSEGCDPAQGACSLLYERGFDKTLLALRKFGFAAATELVGERASLFERCHHKGSPLEPVLVPFLPLAGWK